jgi:hypothetical protein
MPKFCLLNRSDGLLEAADDDSLEVMRRLPKGIVFEMEYRAARNPANHRRWFAFVSTTFDMQDQYEDKEIWRKVLQMLAGHFDEVVDQRGQTHYWPRSISFKELDDELVFRDLFRRAVNGFLSRYGNGMSEQEFMAAMDFV